MPVRVFNIVKVLKRLTVGIHICVALSCRLVRLTYSSSMSEPFCTRRAALGKFSPRLGAGIISSKWITIHRFLGHMLAIGHRLGRPNGLTKKVLHRTRMATWDWALGEGAPQSCPLSSDHVCTVTCKHTHMHTDNNNGNNKLYINWNVFVPTLSTDNKISIMAKKKKLLEGGGAQHVAKNMPPPTIIG